MRTPMILALAAAVMMPTPALCARESTDDPLILAAAAGDAELTEQLLADGAEVNVVTTKRDYTRGWTPLMFAIQGRHEEVVRLLLDADADLRPTQIIERRFDSEQTIYAEILAARYGTREIMELLLDAGGDFTIERNDTDSLLHLAAGNTDPALVAFLIDEVGLDADTANEQGQTPLYAACFWRRELADPLDADPIPRDREMEGSRLAIMQTLLDRGARPHLFDSSGYTPLLIAAKHGLASMVQLLLDNGAYVADPGDQRFNPMLPPEDQAATAQSVLIGAAGSGDRGVPTMLAESGANTETMLNGHDLLVFAVGRANPLVITELIELGYDPNQTLGEGRTLLMYACLSYTDTSVRRDRHRGHVHVAKALIDAGVDVNATDDAGRTALHYAAGSGVPELVELFLNAGADPLAEDAEGRTPADYTTPDAVRLGGARIANEQRALGAAPLERAIQAREDSDG